MIAVLDDCSRLCCHGQWYYSEDAECLIHAFCQAAAKRGLCREFMTDKGGAMRAQETQNGLARLGVKHCFTLPYSPYQNGKQEEFWVQVEGRLLPMMDGVEPLTLEFLNKATQAWLEGEYNRKRHDALGCSPLERVLQGHSVARPAPDSEAMRLAFSVQEPRTQRRTDGTITILGVRFELPSSLRHRQHVQVKYRSFDLSQAYVVDDHSGEVVCRILPLDRVANANFQRRVRTPVGASTEPAPATAGGPTSPLMRKLLREHDAAGLPPAYIPLDKYKNGDNNNDSNDNNYNTESTRVYDE
jgi:hypothetical protein